MAKIKLTIESNREYDMSDRGMILGIYSYYSPGGEVTKIINFISEANAKLTEKGAKKRCMQCKITKMDGPMAELIIKGKKEDILLAANTYLAKSKILEKFTVTIK